MGSWAQSKSVTGQCWALVKQNRYFLAFPLIAFVIGVVLILVLGVPAAVLVTGDKQESTPWLLGVALFVLMAYLIAFWTQFSMAALVAAADEELHGRPSSVGGGFGRARKRIGAIAAWALLAALFRLVMAFIQNKAGAVGDVVSIVGGIAWRLVTFFVLPFIVLDEEGALTGIKDSAKLLKKRWGMQLSGGVRIGGLIGLVVVLPAVLVCAGGIIVSLAGAAAVGIPVAAIALIVLLGASLLLATLRGVFAVALFRYAGDEQALGGFAPEQLQAAVVLKR